MSICDEVHEIFQIPLKNIKENGTDEALCLVHTHWLQYLKIGEKIPLTDLNIQITEENLLEYFSSLCLPDNSVWKFFCVYRRENLEKTICRYRKPFKNSAVKHLNLTYAQLICYITQANYRNVWKQAWHTYNPSKSLWKSETDQTYDGSIEEVIQRLFFTKRFQRTDGKTIHIGTHSCRNSQNTAHPNMLSAICAVEEDAHVLFLCEYIPHTLNDCLLFSPCVLNGSNIQPLFLIYQLIQLLRSIHDSGLHMGITSLSSIKMKENLWLKVFPEFKISFDKTLNCQKNSDKDIEVGYKKPDHYDTKAKTTSSLQMMISQNSKSDVTKHNYNEAKCIEKNLFGNPLSGIRQVAKSELQNIAKNDSANYQSEEIKIYGNIRNLDIKTNKTKFSKLDLNHDIFEATKTNFNSSNSSANRHALNKHFDLPALVQAWMEGAVSNYDYLLFLNKLAGRKENNPKCHFIMPWVMNFSVPDGGWRDLSKSKFRLNKGDKQLDMIYQSAIEASCTNVVQSSVDFLHDSATMVPHHTSEMLTDITYYVYKARQMPKSFLCQHVRPNWVPAEYPSTIERLQEWTPDECIPEFFSDPLIFKSIHSDLNDLGIPWWSTDPEDFIVKHRHALESYYVSERLHFWIDIIFGYKLSGPAALKSKNICLHLVDHHMNVRNSGMVQLFPFPHPHKLGKCLFTRSLAPKTFRSFSIKSHETKDSGDDDTSSESSTKPGFLKGFRSKSNVSSEVIRPDPRPENQTIVLPKDFNPLLSLQHLESLYSFQLWTGGVIKDNRFYKTEILKEPTLQELQIQDMIMLGCLIVEIALPAQTKALPCFMHFERKYISILKMLKLYQNNIAKPFQKVIQRLLHLTPTYDPITEDILNISHFSSISLCGLPLPSSQQLLIRNIHTVPFPSYFPRLYSFLKNLNLFENEITKLSNKGTDNETMKEIESFAEKNVLYAAHLLKKLLPTLNLEGIELLMPYLTNMFKNKYTSLHCTWHMFIRISQAIGPQQTCKKFLKLLIKVFETDNPTPKHIKLYHRSFLLQIIIGLGLQNFLIHFTTILIEAVGGCKDFNSMRKSIEIHSKEEPKCLSNKLEETGRFIDTPCLIDESILLSNSLTPEVPQKRTLSTLSDSSSNYTESVKIDDNMNCNTSITNSEQRFSTARSDSINIQKVDAQNVFKKDLCYSKSAPISFQHPNSTQVDQFRDKNSEKKVTVTHRGLHSRISEKSTDQEYNISDVAVESVIWLAHRLGPVLTARHLTRNLLRMLTLCYDSPSKRRTLFLSPKNQNMMLSVSCKWLEGDINAFKVLNCLSHIVSLYGEQFIMIQYIKHISDLTHLCRKKIPATLESGLHGAMSLLQHIMSYISDKTLMDNLQEIFVKDILSIIIRVVSTLSLAFPGGANSRTMLTLRILDIIYTVGMRIGIEMTRKHLSGAFQKLFSCFDKIFNERGEHKRIEDIQIPSSSYISNFEAAFTEMKQTFTPELAYLAFISFCKIAGSAYMEKSIKNDRLICHFCKYDGSAMLSYHKFQSTCKTAFPSSYIRPHQRNTSFGQDESFVSGVFGKNIKVVGNRLDVKGEENQIKKEISQTASINTMFIAPSIEKKVFKRKSENHQRHLKGNWLAYWEHESGRSEKDTHFVVKQIRLQTFSGHNGTVKAIEVLENENSFLTSSKDKTVKLWSIRSCGNGSAQIPCQWTYNQHHKSVFAVSFLSSLRLVGSCDNTVHIWDPFLGSCIKQIESVKGCPVTCLTAMHPPSQTFLAATTNNTIKFLDARTCNYMHEFKESTGQTGLIRAIAISPNGNWLAVGHSTGLVSVLDTRTGYILGTWLGHDAEILQVKAFNNFCFVTSSLDYSLNAWKFEDSQPKCPLRGPMEPVTSVCFYGNEVISGTSGNRIGVHRSIEKTSEFTNTRIRSDTFKGVLSSMAFLPLNGLLLVGTDNGSVVLLC